MPASVLRRTIIAVARDQPTTLRTDPPNLALAGVWSHIGGVSGLAERAPHHKREVGHAKA